MAQQQQTTGDCVSHQFTLGANVDATATVNVYVYRYSSSNQKIIINDTNTGAKLIDQTVDWSGNTGKLLTFEGKKGDNYEVILQHQDYKTHDWVSSKLKKLPNENGFVQVGGLNHIAIASEDWVDNDYNDFIALIFWVPHRK
eukprot:Phypoly_transcript_16094.p1 GENE.Phypoly_transcript_16094~~Phypoly_transcript_16094.p1  ORF type:complete len:142 (+),score=30.18 Phypoly_transcript_16094:143-568(+)